MKFTRLQPRYLFAFGSISCIVPILVITAFVSESQADIVWNYFSTDQNQTTTMSGQLTTTGTPGDEFGDGQEFSLVSYENVFIDGVEFAGWDLVNGTPPPFTFRASGSITTVGNSGEAVLSFNNAEGLLATDAGFYNYIILGNVFGSDNFVGSGSSQIRWLPAVTTFQSTTNVPEPSTLMGFGLLGLGALRRGKRRTRRDPS